MKTKFHHEMNDPLFPDNSIVYRTKFKNRRVIVAVTETQVILKFVNLYKDEQPMFFKSSTAAVHCNSRGIVSTYVCLSREAYDSISELNFNLRYGR